jgi:hypothetical protein
MAVSRWSVSAAVARLVIKPLGALLLALAALGFAAPNSFAVAGIDFADWTSTGGTTATGTLVGSPVTLTGWQLSPLPESYLNGTLPIWSAPYFTPPLPAADAVEFRAEAAAPHTYTLSLGAARTNPVLHLASLGTTLQFPAGTSITRLSGEDGFVVSGSRVIGAGDPAVDQYGLTDSNGSVRLEGTFTSISFTATTTYNLDGVLVQVGVPVAPPRTTIVLRPPRGTLVGGYDGRVTVRVTAAGAIPGRALETRCALDPPAPPSTFDDLPASSCQYVSERVLTALGTHAMYAASRDPSGSTEAPVVRRAFRIAGGPPDTVITAGPADGAVINDDPAFAFDSTEEGSTFECAFSQLPVANHDFAPCTSPQAIPLVVPAGGTVDFQVRATDAAGNVDPTPARRVVTYQPPKIDLSVDGIEITQGVQETGCASAAFCQSGIMAPDRISRLFHRNPPSPYQGVTLSTARTTIVRVYTHGRGPATYTKSPVVALAGFDGNGRVLQPDLLFPNSGPIAPPACCSSLTLTDRSDPKSAYTFKLPPSWSQHRTLRLRAAISARSPRVGESRPIDNQLDVVGIPFKVPTTIRLRPVEMKIRGIGAASPTFAFEGALATFPDQIEIPPYQGVVDATDAAQEPVKKRQISKALELIDDFADDRGYESGVFPFGLYLPGLGLDTGATLGESHFLFWSNDPRLYGDRTAAYAPSIGRPLGAVAHELGHGLDLPHAGLKCGGNDNGQIGSAWAPDDEGRVNGFGMDTRLGGVPLIYADTAPPNLAGTPLDKLPANAFWDLMSYCPAGSGDGYHWLSPRNWTYLLNYFAPATGLAARARHFDEAAPAKVSALGITGLLGSSGGATIQGVRRLDAAPTPSIPLSPWHVVVRGADGRVLSDTGVLITTLHTHDERDAGAIQAKVPAAGAASVEIVNAGKVVAERRRSSHTPNVTIVSPRRGARLRKARTTLRWRAADADDDVLTVSADYSGDGGRHWKTIFLGRDRGSITLPTRLLTGSRNARLRIRANDGFTETARTSARFVSDGAPPTVRIVTPTHAVTIRADATLVAQGDAYDDRGRRISPRRLTWRLGGRTVGHGRQLGAVDLPAGRQRLQLRAHDSRGRRGMSSVLVRVARVAPRFVVLRAPRSIRPKARTVRLRVTTNVAATLRIAGRRFHVTRRSRRVAFQVPSGRRPLRLHAVLTAGGQSSTALLVIRRR